MRAVFATALTILSLGTAHAHIHLTSPLSRTDSPTGDQKAEHCGVAGQGRIASRVTVFQPGQTITVTWMETINHPGHYRIAFQPDGDTFGIPPPTGADGFPSVDQTGMTDGAGALILKDFIADGTSSTQITLPSMECSNCTLQFIQVMTDKPPYTVDAASNDIYFNCADITLSATGPGPTPDGGTPNPEAGVEPPVGGESGCCSTSNSSPTGIFLGLAVGALILRRRRRR
jgi:MYXO-CTERM domain-containing protein